MHLNTSYVNRVIKALIMALLIPVSLLACKSTTVIDERREAATSIEIDESIVILGRRHNSEYETEEDFVDCVGSSLTTGGDKLNVIPEQIFVDSMYPYFETSTAPMDVKNLNNLIKIPAIAEKFSDFNIRYFIWIDGFTERTDSAGSISCSIGPGGAGCFGFATWDDESEYEASIWDFKTKDLSGMISASTQGTSYMPAVVIPIPLLANVESNACKRMADQIESFIVNG
jgi:hypothetical protein